METKSRLTDDSRESANGARNSASRPRPVSAKPAPSLIPTVRSAPELHRDHAIQRDGMKRFLARGLYRRSGIGPDVPALTLPRRLWYTIANIIAFAANG